MKLLYIANIRLPTEKAHGAQIMHMCNSFARNGAEVELLIPRRYNQIKENPFTYYGIEQRFLVHWLYVPDTIFFGRIGFSLQHLLFSLRAAWFAHRAQPDIVYSRDPFVLALLGSLKERSIWEAHDSSNDAIIRFCARRARRVVSISQGLQNWWSRHGIDSRRTIVAHDGVDLRAFEKPESKDVARKRLGLPLEAKIAMYIGKLGGWKGVETLYEASRSLDPDCLVVIIGGTPQQITQLSRAYPAVRFLGSRPYRELQDNQAAADVLVLPNTGKHRTSAEFTSPLKLFAYMTSGRPIVASDVPSIREILDDESAYIVPADDSEALARKIREALFDRDGSARRAEAAQRKVQSYSWDDRARAILAFAAV